MEAFDVLELLGAGGCASVYRVRRKSDGALFALKRVSATSSASSEQQERLCTEQLILRTLHSPFVCCGGPPIDDQDGEDAGSQLFLLEYIDGKPLYQCVWSYKQAGRFPERVAKFVAAQIALALAEVHAHGFIHRDLKSGNVLVNAHGFIKVIDFGFAKQIGHNEEITECRPTRTHSFCGTHYVMAPEIFQRSSHGFEADWWSFGVVIYEMVVGRPPWEYKPSAGVPIEHYFGSIAEITATFQAGDFELRSSGSLSSSPLDPWSPELLSLLRGLLTMEPEQRLGRHGAAEVMAHPWFHGTDWDLLRAKESRCEEIVSPYNLQTDFVVRRDDLVIHPMHGEPWSSSSAESIDPEDNEKYFADF